MAKAADRIPTAAAMPGGSWYEPKWDGFRAAIVRGADAKVSIWSRTGTDLTARFPELAAAAATQLPAHCVLDGEIVAWADGRLDFSALQRRMVSSRASILAEARTGTTAYVAFDLLEVAGTDTRHLPLRDRRALLEELAKDWAPPMTLSPGTTDEATARAWFDDLAPTGVEGLVVKGGGQRYEGGRRQWVKVKRRESLDTVAAAVIGTVQRPEALLVGLPMDGELRIVGRTTAMAGARAAAVGALLLDTTSPLWPDEVPRRWVERFSEDRTPLRLTAITPVVVEVSADAAWDGRSFRHALRLVRVRPDNDVATVQKPGDLVTPPRTVSAGATSLPNGGSASRHCGVVNQ